MLDIEGTVNKDAYACLNRLETLGLLRTYSLKIMSVPTDTMKAFAKYYNAFIKDGVLSPEYEMLEIGQERDYMLISCLKFNENKIDKISLVEYMQYRFPKDYLYYLLWLTLEQTSVGKSLSYYTKLFPVYAYYMNNYSNLETVNYKSFNCNGIYGVSFFMEQYRIFLEKKEYLNESALGMSHKVWTLFCMHMEEEWGVKLHYTQAMLDEATREIELAKKDTAPETKQMPVEIMGDPELEIAWLLENDVEFKTMFDKKRGRK